MFVSRDMIQQLIEQVALVVLRAAGLRRNGKLKEAEEELAKGMHQISGGPMEMLESVDAYTAATLLGDAAAVRAYADFVAERGFVRLEAGDQPASQLDLERAMMLYERALELGHQQAWPREGVEQARAALNQVREALSEQ